MLRLSSKRSERPGLLRAGTAEPLNLCRIQSRAAASVASTCWPTLSSGKHRPQTQPVIDGRDCRPFRPDPGSAPVSAVSPPETETPPGNRGASLRVTPLSTASGQWPDVPSMSKTPARSFWPFRSEISAMSPRLTLLQPATPPATSARKPRT